MNATQRKALNDGRPESLIIDGMAVWLDCDTKQRWMKAVTSP